MRIRQLDVSSFKAFSRFTLNLGPNAFLVGPNNAGKSTLVAATRATAWMLSHAMRWKPTGHRAHGSKRARTHALREDQFGLVVENLRHQFRDVESVIRLRTDTDILLTAVWPVDASDQPEPFFFLEHPDGRAITEPKTVRELVGPVGIIPGLYPLNQVERVLDRDYLNQQMEGRRSSQHARNHLLLVRQDDQFEDFQDFALEWLPELDRIDVRTRPGESPGDFDIDVFVREAGDRTEKELFWAGDGMQVFLQLLSHLWRLRDADVIVLDEPDLYLHADLQRRLVRLLESTGAQTITATHSSEMLAEASSDSVIWVDKSRRRGVRRPEPATLEDLSTQIGSSFNLRLASALRAKVVLFVEGDDMSVVRTVARKVGALALARERNCAVIELNGFTNWVHVEPFKWLVSEFLENSVHTFVLLDRDYRTDGECAEVATKLGAAGVQVHVWERKELESYVLSATAISRASGAAVDEVTTLLDDITSEMTPDVVGQFAAHRHRQERSTGRELADTIGSAFADLNAQTTDPNWRLHRYPAKQILKALNRELQGRSLRTVSAKKLAGSLHQDEVPQEMYDWLLTVENAVSARRIP